MRRCVPETPSSSPSAGCSAGSRKVGTGFSDQITRQQRSFMDCADRLRIVHVARAPVGGVLRHILDLATAQAAAGHAVGIVCDSITGGAFEDKLIGGIAGKLALGVTRLPMRRQVSVSDLLAARQVLGHIATLAP